MCAFAEAGAAEVKAQRREAEVREGLGRVVDDLVVHGTAAQRMRVGDERGIERVRCSGVEKSLEAAGGPAEVFDSLDMGAERRHRDECTWVRIFPGDETRG